MLISVAFGSGLSSHRQDLILLENIWNVSIMVLFLLLFVIKQAHSDIFSLNNIVSIVSKTHFKWVKELVLQ